MRRHIIDCRAEGSIAAQYLQNIINEYTVRYIENTIYERHLPKQEQICILEELLKEIKTII